VNRVLMFSSMILFLLTCQTNAQQKITSDNNRKGNVARPDVPRVSALEAYKKVTSGKAIIIHSGGEAFHRRHILGAVNINKTAVYEGRIKVPKLPRGKVEIFIYCY
jgi:hypothetical protein